MHVSSKRARLLWLLKNKIPLHPKKLFGKLLEERDLCTFIFPTH